MFGKKKNQKSYQAPHSASTVAQPKKKWHQNSFVFGILGIALLLVFVSIAYSAAVIVMGTKGVTPKVMIAPMVLFDLVLATVAFSKIFK